MHLTDEEAMALLDLVKDVRRGEYDADIGSVIRFLIAREERREEHCES